MSFHIATDTKPEAGMSDFITAVMLSLFTDQAIYRMAVFYVADDSVIWIFTAHLKRERLLLDQREKQMKLYFMLFALMTVY